MPPVGANVWIEFENDDRRLPVWSGCFWEIGQAPVTSNVYDQKVIKTDKTSIGISDTSGLEEGIRIETTSGLKIVMDSSGIELSNGSSNVRITPTNVVYISRGNPVQVIAG